MLKPKDIIQNLAYWQKKKHLETFKRCGERVTGLLYSCRFGGPQTFLNTEAFEGLKFKCSSLYMSDLYMSQLPQSNCGWSWTMQQNKDPKHWGKSIIGQHKNNTKKTEWRNSPVKFHSEMLFWDFKRAVHEQIYFPLWFLLMITVWNWLCTLEVRCKKHYHALFYHLRCETLQVKEVVLFLIFPLIVIDKKHRMDTIIKY